jgi:RNA polymerase sigma factor (sigma-70 family)
MEFATYLAAMFRRFSDDSETRKDLSGEAYLIFQELLNRYDAGRGVPLRPYLVSQSRALLYSHCRARRNVKRREPCLTEAALDAALHEDPTPKWNHQIDRSRLLEALPDLLRRVPLRQRRVLLWRYYDELSFDEIALRLDVRPATARSLLRHGITRLRELAPASELAPKAIPN